MGRRKGINIKVKNSIPPHSAQSAKKRKGGIREHNFMPVKSHEGHTFYGYESHMDHGTQKYGTARHTNGRSQQLAPTRLL